MRIIAIIFSIGVVLQLSSAVTLRRVKRNDFASNDPKVYYRATKAMVEKFNPLIKAVLMHLPSDEKFQKYKQDLITYLEKTEEEANVMGICFVKTFQQLEDFITLLMPLRYNSPSAEGKAVFALFNKYGYKDLEKDFENFVEGYNVEEFMRQVDMLSEADDFELLQEC